jgi:hypothetical protein
MKLLVKGLILGLVVFVSACSGRAAKSFGDAESSTDVSFSHSALFYEAPFHLGLTSSDPDLRIYYSLDGSEPMPGSAELYKSPIKISRNTVVRARTVSKEGESGSVQTQTLLFLEQIMDQDQNQPGYPSTWGKFTGIPGSAPADYEMDPEIAQNEMMRESLRKALQSLPSMSIVLDPGHLFAEHDDPRTGGIYSHTGAPIEWKIDAVGKGWERAASVEFFDRNGERLFHENAGVKIHGGHSRRPEKSPKHSLRVSFRKQYGSGKLKYALFGPQHRTKQDSFVLRAGYGNSIYHWQHHERIRWQFIRDTWTKETHREMGHVAGAGLYVHLYLNGMYWGIYNPTERIDKKFAEYYLGGDENDYDVLKDYEEIADGRPDNWNTLLHLASDLEDDQKYFALLGKNQDGERDPYATAFIDPISLIDYVLLNFYGANGDWDLHNWIGMRNRNNPGEGLKFFSWDAEHTLKGINDNVIPKQNDRRATGLFHEMMANDHFRQLFAQRVRLHCGEGGALSPEKALQRWKRYADELEPAVLAEYARWGDYRRDVHLYPEGDTIKLYLPEDWQKENAFMQNEYFPKRTSIFVQQLRDEGLLDEGFEL